MSRGSAFARVIGLTRSLSPFEKTESLDAAATGEPRGDTADNVVALTVPAEAPPVIAALAQVTLVGAEAPAAAAPDLIRDAVAKDAIDAIEADIASLLSSLDTVSDLPPRMAGDDQDEDPADDDGDDPTLLLLSELDRLWRADPMVGEGASA